MDWMELPAVTVWSAFPLVSWNSVCTLALEEDCTLLEEATLEEDMLELLFAEELLDVGDGTGLKARPEQRTSSM